MFWLFILMILLIVGTIIAAGVLAARRTLTPGVVGAIIAVGMLVVLTALLWKHAILAVAIAAVCALAVGVMFGRIDPSKAIMGAITAFVLFFVFTWLALQMAEPLLFGRESDLSQWVKQVFGHGEAFNGGDFGSSGFLAALGVACLIGGCFLARWMRALAVFAGLMLLLTSGPRILDEHGLSFRELLYTHDPVLRLAYLGMIVVGIVAVVKLLSQNSKNP